MKAEVNCVIVFAVNEEGTSGATNRRPRVADRLTSGPLRGVELLEFLRALPYSERDAVTDELFGFETPPPDARDLPRASVPYLPCGVDEVLAVLRDGPIGPDDEFVDLGSGIGRVAILVHLLSGARVRGIEIQEHLVHLARARSLALRLPDVTFVHANAAEVELDGSFFFLYAPFNGSMLQAVVARLETVARRRPIVVAAVNTELGDVAWLRPRRSSNPAVSLFTSA